MIVRSSDRTHRQYIYIQGTSYKDIIVKKALHSHLHFIFKKNRESVAVGAAVAAIIIIFDDGGSAGFPGGIIFFEEDDR
jgi:hypothetical protein